MPLSLCNTIVIIINILTYSVYSQLDWRWHNGQRYVTWTRNQNIPNYCNSSYAFAVTSSLSDRLMIMNNNTFPEWILSPQPLLKCDMLSSGCYGGDPINAYKYIQTNGISTEGCAPYQARGCGKLTNEPNTCNITGVHCSPESVCKYCWEGTCGVQYPHQLFYVKEYNTISGENQLIQSLNDGPIVCGMCLTYDLQYNYNQSFYIYNDNVNCQQNHSVSIVGYGIENNQKYWIVRNSFGAYWGYNGYFRIQRGSNILGIESLCSWATLKSASPHWINSSNSTVSKTIKSEKLRTSKTKPVFTMNDACRHETTEEDLIKYGQVIIDPLPQNYIKTQDLPTNFQWNNVNGTNYLTLPRNQRVPNSCASCWAHSTTSALSDRINIIRGMKNESLWPIINLSPQVLVSNVGGGKGCNGGNTLNALKYIYNNGVPHENCQQYQAENQPHGSKNSNLNICEICYRGNGEKISPGVCKKMSINEYKLYFVGQYGACYGIDNMKKEIYARGPIECGIWSSNKFVAYKGGIFSQPNTNKTKINHSISVWGWSITNEGEEYWFGRNSWGQYWGEEGFFRIKMGSNLIETNCTWGVPII